MACVKFFQAYIIVQCNCNITTVPGGNNKNDAEIYISSWRGIIVVSPRQVF